MAPGRRIEDDFVLTINSDDERPLGLDEEDSEPDAAPSKSGSSQKRKRPEETIAADAAKASKKRKQAKNSRGPNEDSEEDSDDEEVGGPQGWADRTGQKDGALNPDFEFQLEQDAGVFEDFDAWEGGEEEEKKSLRKKGVDMDALIERKRALKNGKANGTTRALSQQNGSENEDEEDASEVVEEPASEPSDAESEDGIGFGMGVPLGEDDDEEMEGDFEALDDEEAAEESDIADDMDADHGDEGSDGGSSTGDPEEDARQKAFFAADEGPKVTTGSSFQSMKLSRPILRGLTAIGFSNPTPIQAKTIPMALLGKDVVGGAVTGSGKTGAFMIPILERLLYRNQKVPTSRVAVLMPTRELAVQCFNVATKLASYTDITFCQLVGGFSLREQESILRKRPDVIIATPGRFIDHMRNSASFTVDTLEILVLDEADRMLEQGFADELNEILATIPRSRQTMLFSATMTSSVDELIRVGLNKPVRLMVDSKRQTVGTLVQEFVRLRQGREDKRLAYLLYLCSHVFENRCIIFFRQKKEAHRVRIIFGLFGMKVAELHGSMSQEQRIESVESFRAGKVTHLLATDVASRGLDIKGVEAVINYEAPQSHEIYLHRVGRTARAGRSGRACTIAGEPDRKVVRAAVKAGKSQGAKIVSRVVDPEVADEWAANIDALEQDVQDLLKEEKEERQLQSVEMQVRKGENLIAHESEIMSRPRRDWFQSETEKLAAKKAGVEELNGTHGSSKKKKVKLSNKDKKKLDASRERKEGREWKKGKADRGLNGKPSAKGKKTKGKRR